jgi:hypothetical protein
MCNYDSNSILAQPMKSGHASHLPIDMPTRMDTTRSKMTFGVVDDGSFSVSSHSILLQQGLDGSSAIELWIWWVSNRFPTSNKPPANRHAKNGHHSIKNDIWCCGQRILLCVIPFDLAATDRKGIDLGHLAA